MSRKNTIRRLGHIWTREPAGDWEVTIDNKFHVITWPFGSIHQSKVFIDYEHKVNNKIVSTNVGIGLRHGKTMEEAMQTGLNWVKEFQKTDNQNVDNFFQECWDHWPELYPKNNRPSVIDHVFFVIGNGYDWVNGAIMSTSPHAYLEFIEQKSKTDEILKINIRELLDKETKYLSFDEARKEYWSQDVYKFYPVSDDYSNICLVPDDVKPDWLKLSYEAAKLLRDKSGNPKVNHMFYGQITEDNIERQEKNKEMGTKIVEDLEKRFPQLL